MSEPLTLDLLDKDGAIREALDEGMQGTTGCSSSAARSSAGARSSRAGC